MWDVLVSWWDESLIPLLRTLYNYPKVFNRKSADRNLFTMFISRFSRAMFRERCSGNDPEHTETDQESRCSGTTFQTKEGSSFSSGTKFLFQDQNKRNGTRNNKKFELSNTKFQYVFIIFQHLSQFLSFTQDFIAEWLYFRRILI